MSYAINVAIDARRALSALPIGVQESVWDVLEQLAADPDAIETRRTWPHPVHQLVCGEEETTFHVIILIFTDHEAQALFVPALFPWVQK